MPPFFYSIGQILKGHKSTYTIAKELHRGADEATVYLARDQNKKKCIIKSIRGHSRLQNEANVLRRYQHKTPLLRSMIDEILTPSDPPSIVLKYMDSELWKESGKKNLTRLEIKQVSKCVFEALLVLHKDGMVHTDVKLDNVFVKFGQGEQRFSKIQLWDCGGVVSQDSKPAREGHPIGADVTRSPEAMWNTSWGTPTDVWSVGNMILSLLHGGQYYHFDPEYTGFEPGHELYRAMILKQMYDLLGPWPLSLADIITDPKDQEAIQYSMAHGRPRSPIARWPKQCMPFADGKFLKRIMKLDPRDRPTVEEILKDEWFTEGSEDTRIPMPPQPTLSEDNASSEALKHSRWIVNQFNLDRFDQRDLFNLI